MYTLYRIVKLIFGESVAMILLNTYVRIGQSCKRCNKKEIADIYAYIDKLLLVRWRFLYFKGTRKTAGTYYLI